MLKYVAIVSLLIYLSILMILVINLNQKNKIIKYGFVIVLLLILGVVTLTNENVLENILSIGIRYIYYPYFSSYMTTLILSLIILIYTIFNERIKDKERIINYVFASLLLISYILFMMLGVDVNSYNKLYNGTSLIMIRYATRTFAIWIGTIIFIGLVKNLRKLR